MSTPFFDPQGRNINKLDSISFKTLNTGVAYIDSTGRVVTKQISTYEIADSVNLPGVPTTATADSGTNTNQIATTEYVQQAIADFAVSDNETISGIKTFSDSIVTPTATISGVTFQDNTVYINGGFNLNIKEITNVDDNAIITLLDLGFPYYQFYILNCSATTTTIQLDIPSPVHSGVRIVFRKKQNTTINFSTNPNSYIVAANSRTLTNIIPMSTFCCELICDGTQWYQFNIN